MKTRKPVAIEDLLKGAIKSLRLQNKLTQEEVAGIWQEAVGSRAASHTRPVGIKKTSLTVNVDDSGWLYELTIKKKEILEKLEGKFKGKDLKNIRFRIGEINEREERKTS